MSIAMVASEPEIVSRMSVYGLPARMFREGKLRGLLNSQRGAVFRCGCVSRLILGRIFFVLFAW